MKHQKIKLSIENPCSQDWNAMTTNAQGKFCDHCAKSVIDFTKLSDQEIIQLLSNNSGSICGRAKSQQLNRIIETEKTKSFSAPYKFLAGLFLVGTSKNTYATTGLPLKLPITQSTVDHSKNQEASAPRDSLLTTVEGIVRNGDLEPVIGAIIKIRDTQLAAVSDIDGKFRFELPDTLDLNIITLYSEYYEGTGNDVTIDRRKTPFLIEMYITTAHEIESVGMMVVAKPKKKWQFWR